MYLVHTAFCMYEWLGKGLRGVSYKPLNAADADDFSHIFIHRNMQLPWVRTHERFCGSSDAYATLSLLARLFPCCKSRRNISSRSCHRALWAALQSHTSLFRHACMVILIRKHYCISYTMMKSVWRTSPLSAHSKLKGQCSDVKNGCGPSV